MANHVYEGWRDEQGAQVDVDGFALKPDDSLKIVRHSPDGFEWGYGGSGPAQLALGILFHHFTHYKRYSSKRAAKEAEQYHQDFKWKVISNLGESWHFDSAFVEEALQNIRQERPERYGQPDNHPAA